MGKLVEGVWHDVWYDTKATAGRFKRTESSFRNWVTADGSPGPTGTGGFGAEPGRYHLYVSYACPWAHRTLITRALKGLTEAVPVSVVDHHMGSDGWTFRQRDGATGDQVNGFRFLRETYLAADPHYTGRVTVPVLWDTIRKTIVSNESADIVRMFNSAFDQWADRSLDFYPPELRREIDALNDEIYPAINNGVYRAGFATTQEAYEEAFHELFSMLDRLEERLDGQRYLTGNRLTEADIRLFPTLVRFDAVYVGHFKCNLRRIEDYPNLSNYTRDIFQLGGIADTVNMLHIKNHYYGSHPSINPTGIVPCGPALDFSAPHDRDRFQKPQMRSAGAAR